MAEMLSPGVFITEIDASAIVPTVSNSIAVFAGRFSQGPVNKFQIITNTDDLITYYGKPNNDNYNDWYQCYNFLQYSNKLLICRAANVRGTYTDIDGAIIGQDVLADINKTKVLEVANTFVFNVGDVIGLSTIDGSSKNFYTITSIEPNVSLTLDRFIEDDIDAGQLVQSFKADLNGVFEATTTGTAAVPVPDYISTYISINNYEDFEMKETSIAFSGLNSKLKIIAKNPGTWSKQLEIAIALPADFKNNKYVFAGISLDDLFEYAPIGSQVGIVISYNDEIKEVFTVDFNELAKDMNSKSTYIETVINAQSAYIFVKENKAVPGDIQSYIHSSTSGVIKLVNSLDSDIQPDDLLDAYEVWENKEEIDIDIIIGNELDSGASAKELAEKRADCLTFIGANYADVVGKKNSDAVLNLINWRTKGTLNFNSMFTVACANYKYMYDRYNDKNRWVNIAGDVAGLRSAVNTSRASWWASAGLERGQVKNVIKLAFNPKQAERDYLYKNGLNPVVSFPGQGVVVWGQKTLLDKASSFDRVNVRGLFNTLERSLAKMAKYQVMEFNDTFTRNRIISMIKPFLSSVQAGRGIQDFLVICDESNNTADVISRNQLVVDVYIKPTYVAEFIHLKFTNAGTNSFSSVIGGA